MAVASLVGLFATWDFTIDDAYISFRYANNFASGDGLRWNTEEDPVEGYSNFLWVMLSVIPEALNISTEVFSKILGISCLLMLLTMTYLYTRRRVGDNLLALLPIAFILSFVPTYFHAVSGLETMLYVVLLMALYISSTSVLEANQTGALVPILVPTLGFALGLTRPEGLLPAMWATAWVYTRVRGNARRQYLRALGVLVALGLLYMIFRFEYFGYLFPNTFFVKMGYPAAGSSWLIGAVSFITPFLVVTALVGARRDAELAHHLLFPVGFVFSALLTYGLARPMMDYASRFLYPAAIVVFVMTAVELGRADHSAGAGRVAIVGFVVTLLGCQIFFHMSRREIGLLGMYGNQLERAHVRLGCALRDANIPQHLRSIAIGDAGAVPYYSGWTTIDYVGLNDERIAHGSDRETTIVEALPSLLVLYSPDTTGERVSLGNSAPSKRLLDQYTRLGFVEFRRRYYLALYASRALNDTYREELAEVVRQVANSGDGVNHEVGVADFVDHVFDRFREVVRDRSGKGRGASDDRRAGVCLRGEQRVALGADSLGHLAARSAR